MRRLAALFALLGAALSVGLAAPPPASACTGCATSFQELLDSAPTIVLARYEGRSGRLSVFEVADVLKGRSDPDLRLYTWVFLGPRPRLGSLWLLTPSRGTSLWIFRVGRDGRVTDTDTGAGATDGYQSTLAGWYRALGLAMPDTATAALPVGAPAPGPPVHPALLLAAALAGAGASLRRQRGARAPG